LVPSDHAFNIAMGEKQTDCIRRSHSSEVLDDRASGVHKTPIKLLCKERL
jgi:hypothetical protein